MTFVGKSVDLWKPLEYYWITMAQIMKKVRFDKSHKVEILGDSVVCRQRCIYNSQMVTAGTFIFAQDSYFIIILLIQLSVMR